jgi:hypothetical protein
MNKKILAVMIALLVGLLAGCSSGKTVDESFKGRVEPVAENILQSIQSGDRQAFLKDMDDKMKTAFTEKAFGDMESLLAAKVGAYQSKEYWKAEKSGQYTIAYFKAKFDKESDYVVVKVVTSEKDGVLYVSGLFFDSPNLRK